MTQLSKMLSPLFWREPKIPVINRMFPVLVMALTMLGLIFVPASANASCGLPTQPIKPMAWSPATGTASLQSIDYDDGPSIVGMWHVVFQALTMNGIPIPKGGQQIDNAVVVWHRDGTEIMNSDRPAQDGNFCLGVWKQTGERTYLLNHIPWQGNAAPPPPFPQNAVGPAQGGAQIIENVTLSSTGNSYTGTFTLHSYNPDGSLAVWFSGNLAATRITPTTPFSALF